MSIVVPGGAAYALILIILLIGLYGTLLKQDLFRKLIGLFIFQSAIILFFIAGSVQEGGTVPIVDPVQAQARYVNPLPHVLMLTAIVVSAATTGVALALLLTLYRRYGTLDEEQILARQRGEWP